MFKTTQKKHNSLCSKSKILEPDTLNVMSNKILRQNNLQINAMGSC